LDPAGRLGGPALWCLQGQDARVGRGDHLEGGWRRPPRKAAGGLGGLGRLAGMELVGERLQAAEGELGGPAPRGGLGQGQRAVGGVLPVLLGDGGVSEGPLGGQRRGGHDRAQRADFWHVEGRRVHLPGAAAAEVTVKLVVESPGGRRAGLAGGLQGAGTLQRPVEPGAVCWWLKVGLLAGGQRGELGFQSGDGGGDDGVIVLLVRLPELGVHVRLLHEGEALDAPRLQGWLHLRRVHDEAAVRPAADELDGGGGLGFGLRLGDAVLLAADGSLGLLVKGELLLLGGAQHPLGLRALVVGGLRGGTERADALGTHLAGRQPGPQGRKTERGRSPGGERGLLAQKCQRALENEVLPALQKRNWESFWEKSGGANQDGRALPSCSPGQRTSSGAHHPRSSGTQLSTLSVLPRAGSSHQRLAASSAASAG